ncbi:cyclic nucleotide-binding domain-containing protein [Solwaraspora sp. WMMD406]|uniref:cyclic nucleotide-binding domain-containing protein n=1 Tax=Solwaraspora sp. WMMD406 TaxID=3016095 RepID=UPI002417376E|nr:cyclic nucleotide-binding domain-containing protein [Solwaraspora sp. WMMD406]MDG4766847.1 cyclic nucleotide-binding domain-containing protein [Solwaraspora sp. WMMD406]
MIRTIDLLDSHPFLAGLPRPWLERLSYQARPGVRHSGQRIFQEGHRADRFWLLRSGQVALDFHVPGRGDVGIETIAAGSVLGWSWLFPPYQWQFGAVAVDRTLMIEFDAAGTRRLISQEEALGRELTTRFMQVVVDRLHAARSRLMELYGYPPGPGADGAADGRVVGGPTVGGTGGQVIGG